MRRRRRFEVSGIVQGVGFRPFIYNLATEHSLTGWVRNHSAGVTIEAEGPPDSLDAFTQNLRHRLPPLAAIDELRITDTEPAGDTAFTILFSQSAPSESTPVPADIATCPDCLAELNNPADRRFAYPFINCTSCGPRFTIIRDLPYDRPATTMSAFPMCPACLAEYHDPANRRFHAQPNACPACGPATSPDIAHARALLASEAILAVKGIGGFHLACDATSDKAVGLLRERKNRFGQPFAVMVRDLEAARAFAHIDDAEARLLLAPQRPIVLLRKRAAAALSALVAPGNAYLGVMLPYSPLHHLLLGENPLVMTSANPSGEPIVRDNDEARARLAHLADSFLTHNRDIEVVCDDSVVRTFEGHEMPIRRSRGYAPLPVKLTRDGPSVLAAGAELKAAFCLTKGHFAYLSQHIGDMGTLETQRAFERALAHMLRLFRVHPEAVVCDLHPGYHSARWARDCALAAGIPLLAVQHHHAHVASLVAESGLAPETPVIGLAFDGTGYGTDAAIWGGEVLIVRGAAFERSAHLAYVPMAGGDASVKSPARTALSYLRAANIPWDEDLPCVAALPQVERRLLAQRLERNLNCVHNSSMGRLFDAVSSLIGVCHRISYEGQAAIELESLCALAAPRAYPFALDPAPLLRAIVADLRAGIPREQIAAGFHEAVAQSAALAACNARSQTGITLAGLTGGVFQNLNLLGRTAQLLRAGGFEVLVHRLVPASDGGLSLGQAFLAQLLLKADRAS